MHSGRLNLANTWITYPGFHIQRDRQVGELSVVSYCSELASGELQDMEFSKSCRQDMEFSKSCRQDLEFSKSCRQDLEFSKSCRQDFEFSTSCRQDLEFC